MSAFIGTRCELSPSVAGPNADGGLHQEKKSMDDDACARVAALAEALLKEDRERAAAPDISFDFAANHADVAWRDSSSEAPLASFAEAPIAPEAFHAAGTGLESHAEHDENAIAHSNPAPPMVRFQVALPEMPLQKRHEYEAVYSDTVEAVHDVYSNEPAQYTVEFTDGRLQVISFERIGILRNGNEALRDFILNMTGSRRKRKRILEDEWDEASNQEDLSLDSDQDDQASPRPSRGSRSLRSRRTSTSTSPEQSHISGDEDDVLDQNHDGSTKPPKHNLRQRTKAQPSYASNLSMSVKGNFADTEIDELANDAPISEEDNDGDFMPVISDIAYAPKHRRTGALQRGRQLQAARARSHAKKQARLQQSLSLSSKRRADNSDIEFEAPRRSSRANKNTSSMRDDALMDEESFYILEEKPLGAPRVITIREAFQPVEPNSPFATKHMATCHSCGASKQRGPLIYCQGCSLSYHRQCIGTRSAREHLATKVGHDDFVLQCKFCIDPYRKRGKDAAALAPRYDMCQTCKDVGKACHPFSEKKTARQEEKLREENGGEDPITPVAPHLINNADTLLFRCATCHRGWHAKHIAPTEPMENVVTDVESERLQDYMVNWQCQECSSRKHKPHRLVAWRPAQAPSSQQRLLFDSVSEDDKEYLIKWETLSYRHCTWMPGAWIYGTCAAAMRKAFVKRTEHEDLLKLTSKDAIPDEFVMADIILNVKMLPGVSKNRSREYDFANIDNVGKVFVKFQGLGHEDVVWDTPPPKDQGDIYAAFEDAYYDYVEGKHFKSEPHQKIRDRIKWYKASDLEGVASQPAGLKKGKLMGYQLEGMNWLLKNFHRGRNLVLADEMGLGKTIQVISFITSLVQDSPKCWPFLIVVPNATCPNWRREFKQWAPDIRVVAYHGGREAQEMAYKYELFPHDSMEMKAHVVIMSYDSAQDPKTRTLFKSIRWTGLVVDEGQRLKNDQNLLYGALQAMKIPFRLLLTGTPLQNNKRELFNLLHFVDPQHDAAKLDEEFQVLNKENLPKLHEMIRPYFLRRTKLGVLKFLPPMAQIIIPVTMTSIQEKLSKSIMAKNPALIKAIFANNKMNNKDRSSLNNILMQLRKCLCHPFIYSDAIEERHHDAQVLHRNLVEASAKLLLFEVLLPKLRERGHRVLIFSQFLSQLDILEDFLSAMDYQFRRLDGSLSSLEKQRRIDAFNEPDSPIFAFLLSTRAGGVGINLATADTVIIMDPDFNPHQDIQALSRAHRIGQVKKVLCFQLVTKDSVEERIMQVGRKKMALDHALIESMDDGELAGDDLESILKYGAQALFSEDYQKRAIKYDGPSIDKLLDRSNTEQTEADDEGSAETQFSHARIWANEKSGFDEGLDTAEEQAPEPITSSVWDKILAEREEEARREAEANKEQLGRGGRRRVAVNYKVAPNKNTARPETVESESDSSDAFSGAGSGESESEDDGQSGQAADDANPIKPRLPTNSSKAASQGTTKPTDAQGHSKRGQQGPVERRQVGRPAQATSTESKFAVDAPGYTGKSQDAIKAKYRHRVRPEHQVQQVGHQLPSVPVLHSNGSVARFDARNSTLFRLTPSGNDMSNSHGNFAVAGGYQGLVYPPAVANWMDQGAQAFNGGNAQFVNPLRASANAHVPSAPPQQVAGGMGARNMAMHQMQRLSPNAAMIELRLAIDEIQRQPGWNGKEKWDRLSSLRHKLAQLEMQDRMRGAHHVQRQ
ncbi:hypothetical protein CDD82_3422 [Ophiocordyceps australis]|uniref:PHD-type domain-containing protein n=1 Tax=Ophiocordyceps australis TaxID=1399860 RepID=A0A2C5Y5H7_9HYPO|nr:hypothetical protein CDD82_3422 [Ophiocordyceps australis]